MICVMFRVSLDVCDVFERSLDDCDVCDGCNVCGL